MGLCIGIDLGTTNSVAGLATPEGVKLVSDGNGSCVHASVVSFPEVGGIVVGNDAKVRKATDPTQTIYSAKRLIGQSIRSPMVQLAVAALPFEVEEGGNQQAIIHTRNRKLSVPEVSSLVLKHLMELCENRFGEKVEAAVITVPANFSDAQRQATKEAGRLAGLEVLRLVNEPTAAALAYGYGKEMNQRVAVFDFGGGPFDLSLLKIDADIFEVLATDGEFFLGGDDIDRILAEFLATEMNRSLHIDPRPIASAMNRLQIAAEQIKHYLSESDEAGGTIDGIVINPNGDSVSVNFEIFRDQFESMIAGYVDRTIDICRNVMTHAGLKIENIDDIILVGGTTRIPLVRNRISEFFGKEPATDINADEVVAHGAALQAAMLAGRVHDSEEARKAPAAEYAAPIHAQSTVPEPPAPQTSAQEEFVVHSAKELPQEEAETSTEQASAAVKPVLAPPVALLLDVTPDALRIATAGGYTDCFLEKNSPIPIERTQVFTTAHNDQSSVVIQCCRGTSRFFEDNELLGSLELEGIAPGSRGEAQIRVTFRVDPDGILHVKAIDERSQQTVEARLNVVGAPSQDDFALDSSLPNVAKSNAREAKARAKAEKATLKQRKRDEKAREKAAKKSAKTKEKTSKESAP